MERRNEAPKRTLCKTLALVLSLVLVIGCVVGGTLAWLTDSTQEVKNTFTPSKVDVDLGETEDDFDMVPGCSIAKDPKVTVKANSEACYLFVKVTESSTPDLDAYIKYAIAEGWTELNNNTPDSADELILYREVSASGKDQSFGILGGSTYTFGDMTFTWGADEVLTLPDVTEEMMEAIDGFGADGNPVTEAEPTLTFTAYVIQHMQNDTTEFVAADAWELVKTTYGLN